MAKLCNKLRKMFMEAEQTNQSPNMDSEHNVLASLGIKVGDKVMVGGVKVSAASKVSNVQCSVIIGCE